LSSLLAEQSERQDSLLALEAICSPPHQNEASLTLWDLGERQAVKPPAHPPPLPAWLLAASILTNRLRHYADHPAIVYPLSFDSSFPAHVTQLRTAYPLRASRSDSRRLHTNFKQPCPARPSFTLTHVVVVVGAVLFFSTCFLHNEIIGDEWMAWLGPRMSSRSLWHLCHETKSNKRLLIILTGGRTIPLLVLGGGVAVGRRSFRRNVYRPGMPSSHPCLYQIIRPSIRLVLVPLLHLNT
jgi:hypothetical protein